MGSEMGISDRGDSAHDFSLIFLCVSMITITPLNWPPTPGRSIQPWAVVQQTVPESSAGTGDLSFN